MFSIFTINLVYAFYEAQSYFCTFSCEGTFSVKQRNKYARNSDGYWTTMFQQAPKMLQSVSNATCINKMLDTIKFYRELCYKNQI